MRAVRATGDGGVAVVEVEPTIPEYARDPVRVRVRSASICGSDLHMLAWSPAATLGHEFAGLLDDGTPVAVQPNAPCGECDLCIAGRDNHCRLAPSRFHGVYLDGGLADEVIVDRRHTVVLPHEVGAEIGSLVEPIAVGVRAAHLAGLHDESPEGPVLVVGAGSIGLAVVAAVRHHGIDVDVAARHAAQRDAGERLGAGHELRDEYEVVIDCAGTQSSLDDAIARVRPGGTIVVPGTYWQPVQIGMSLATKAPKIVMSQMYAHHHGVREFDEAVEVLAANPDIAGTLITHRFPLDDAPEAFRTAADRAAGVIKVVIEP